MKIRTGFVSNSSSSSFVIAFDEQLYTSCPHCGRKDISILDLVDRANSNNSDNQVEWSDPGERIKYLQNEIEQSKRELVDLERMNPDHKPNPYWTVKDKINWVAEQLKENEREVDLIIEALSKGLSVVEISISHHDEFLNSEFNALVKTGKVKVLKGGEE